MKRILCGPHAIREALASNPRALAMLLIDRAPEQLRGADADLAASARAHGVSIESRTTDELDALARGVRHQGLVAISGADYPYLDLETALSRASATPLLLALDEITDVHNFGAIIRSAVALGADAVLTLRDRAAPVNAAVVRASAGATEHARIARVTNLAQTLDALARRDFAIVGLDGAADHGLAELDLRAPTVLVVGSEGRGLRRLVREKCTVLGKIPMPGPLAALNASVAASIALYEATRQRNAPRADH